jgi:hypothetical protein
MRFNEVYKTNKPFDAADKKPSSHLPLPPLNVFVLTPYINGVLDIRWDDPKLIPENTLFFSILGVNIYRSFDSEGGLYTKLNPEPLGVGVYRDQTKNTLIENEVVTNLETGLNSSGEWRFKTRFFPLCSDNPDAPYATSRDVVVKIDNGDGLGLLEVPIHKVDPRKGDVILISSGILDPQTQKIIPPRLPTATTGSITVSYKINSNKVSTALHNRIFYKLTTVAIDQHGQTLETELSSCKAVTLYQQEKTDWIWKESIRRNRWILEQSGERVQVYIRKWNGQLCEEYSEDHENSPHDCPVCLGTNVVGGYEGPFDIIIAPPDAEKNVELTEIGLRVNYTFDSWTGPSPMLNKRDIVVRPTGERFSVGNINYVGQRGAIFQQMFQLQQLDSGDMAYKVGLKALVPAPPFDTRTAPNEISERPSPVSPTIPSGKPSQRNYPIEKGRTVTFEDIMY